MFIQGRHCYHQKHTNVIIMKYLYGQEGVPSSTCECCRSLWHAGALTLKSAMRFLEIILDGWIHIIRIYTKTWTSIKLKLMQYRKKKESVIYHTFSWLWYNFPKIIQLETIKMTSKCASTRLRAPASQWFVQTVVQVNIKGNIKALHYTPFIREIHWSTENSRHKVLVMQKAFPCHDIIMQKATQKCIPRDMEMVDVCMKLFSWNKQWVADDGLVFKQPQYWPKSEYTFILSQSLKC